jgi:hypothetical protein
MNATTTGEDGGATRRDPDGTRRDAKRREETRSNPKKPEETRRNPKKPEETRRNPKRTEDRGHPGVIPRSSVNEMVLGKRKGISLDGISTIILQYFCPTH